MRLVKNKNNAIRGKMIMRRKGLGIFVLSILLSFGSFSGCSTHKGEESLQTTETIDKNSQAQKNKKDITMESIEQDMIKIYGDQVERVFISNKYDENTVLIEVKMKLGASNYYVYNLATGENYMLPIEFSFVKSTKFIDENSLVFEMIGSDSETPYKEPPYQLCFYKIVGNDGFKFKGEKEKTKLELGNGITCGDNIYNKYFLKDIRDTLDGIQLDFKAVSGETDSFPIIKTSFNESNRQFIIKADKTKMNNLDYLAKVITEKPNIYIDSLRLEEENDAVNIILELNKNACKYTAEIRDMSFLEICFHNK